MTLLSILGFFILLFGIIMLILKPSSNYLPKLQPFNRRTSLLITTVGLFMFLFQFMFFYANQGFQYYLISPLGGKSVEYNQGFHWRGFSKVQEWDKYFDIKGIDTASIRRNPDILDGIEGPLIGGVSIRFIDNVTASVFPYVRIQMPTDPDAFILLAEEFKTPQNLVLNTLVPTVQEQVINTGYMYTGEDYVSGNASNFRQDIDDQLKNGGFAVNKKERQDTIESGILQDDQRQIREIKTVYTVEKRTDNNKVPIRIPHDITRNKLIIGQVIVSTVELEPKFKIKLETQRDISANKRIELQKVETAKATQQRIIAEGESSKAEERVTQELLQVKTLIGIETQKKSEETKRELAEIALKTAMLTAQKVKVENDAQAYANKLLKNAGLTPLDRANIDKETAIGVAAEIAKLDLPDVLIMNGSGTGGKDKQQSMLETLIGAELAKKMLNSTKEK